MPDFVCPFWGRLAVLLFGYRTNRNNVIARMRPGVAGRGVTKWPKRRPAAIEAWPGFELPDRAPQDDGRGLGLQRRHRGEQNAVDRSRL